MITIKQVSDYWSEMVTRIDELTDSILVINQQHLTERIKELQNGIYLLVVIPGSKSDSPDDDNIRDESNCLVFVIEKLDIKSVTHAELISNHMSVTQKIADNIKMNMIEDKRVHTNAGHLMHDLDPSGIVTEPEYNFMGTYGWSFSFTINPILSRP